VALVTVLSVVSWASVAALIAAIGACALRRWHVAVPDTRDAAQLGKAAAHVPSYTGLGLQDASAEAVVVAVDAEALAADA
jgi:hypothetical protein